jgi:hypothetical protein
MIYVPRRNTENKHWTHYSEGVSVVADYKDDRDLCAKVFDNKAKNDW